MAATSTSSMRILSEEFTKKEDATVIKLKAELEKVRLENKNLQRDIELERSGVRALKAQHEASLRRLSNEAKKKQQSLEKQLRNIPRANNPETTADPALRRLSAEVQALKVTNKALQEKLESAELNARDAAEQTRVMAQQHASQLLKTDRQARIETHLLLEEIKSKDRLIDQLKKTRSAAEPVFCDDKKNRRMECGFDELRKLNLDQKNNDHRDDLDTEIQHRKETFYRTMSSSDMDSAVCSAPPSLSPQPLGSNADIWSCTQCRSSMERAEASARESARLADSLKDARDQLELLEFRLLELEDAAAPEKVPRDSDSGCVSPGSRLQDSASPELRRTDSGYKSPGSSPSLQRRPLYNEDVLCEQVRCLLSRADSEQDRDCLQRVVTVLQHCAAVTDMQQLQPSKECDHKTLSRLESELVSPTKCKAVATVNPYSQTRRSLECSSLESLCDEPRKISRLQESGIFDDVETEEKATQTAFSDSLEGDLNTEIQRLNSIREKLERRGVSRASPLKGEEEGLECRCVKLGQRHKQYYERRLKFLEGKISIYEAAQDVKKAKLAERLQKEFILENRVQELEHQLSTLQEKYERLEEECCELDELENDTRLHAQQLETDYELVTAQLHDMCEQRECSRAQAERLAKLLAERSESQKSRVRELSARLKQLEAAVPAIISWNVVQAINSNISCAGQSKVEGKFQNIKEQKALVENIKRSTKAENKKKCQAVVVWNELTALNNTRHDLESALERLAKEKKELEKKSSAQREQYEKQIEEYKKQIEGLKCSLQQESVKRHAAKEKIDMQRRKVEDELAQCQTPEETNEIDPKLTRQLYTLIKREQDLTAKVKELEKRETAYLQMLTQADDMWAEMEGGYKQKIDQANRRMSDLEKERDRLSTCCFAERKKVADLKQSESSLRLSLEKMDRDLQCEQSKTAEMQNKLSAMEENLSMSQASFKQLAEKFKLEKNNFRQKTALLAQQLESEKEQSQANEAKLSADLERVRREMARTCKHVQDLEVTAAELREEVESLESQLTLMQKSMAQCKRKCDERVKTMSRELSIKTEELEELRSDVMRRSLRPNAMTDVLDRTEYVDDATYIVPSRYHYDKHHSLGYIQEGRCSCPSTRTRLVGSLIEDLFERMHDAKDSDLVALCVELNSNKSELSRETVKAKVSEYLMMAISKELVRSIGDADLKADSEEWTRGGGGGGAGGGCGNAGVMSGAERLASVSCACAAARLCGARPDMADTVKMCQEEVLEHSDVKIMEEQLASAIENIVNCPSCALGSNAIVWSTDV